MRSDSSFHSIGPNNVQKEQNDKGIRDFCKQTKHRIRQLTYPSIIPIFNRKPESRNDQNVVENSDNSKYEHDFNVIEDPQWNRNVFAMNHDFRMECNHKAIKSNVNVNVNVNAKELMYEWMKYKLHLTEQNQQKESKEQYQPNEIIETNHNNWSMRMDVMDITQTIKKVHFDKRMTINNPLVIMIGISEYDEEWSNLVTIKTKDHPNMKQLFQQKLNYTFVCNDVNKRMTSFELHQFMVYVKSKYKLINNYNEFDGIIFIICGQGMKPDQLVTSDGELNSIVELFDNLNMLESFVGKPKILISDVCRGTKDMIGEILQEIETVDDQLSQFKQNLRCIKTSQERQQNIYQDKIMIRSTIDGYSVPDFGYFLESINNVISNLFHQKSLQEMIDIVKGDVSDKCSMYCVNLRTISDYRVFFQRRH